MSPLPTLSPGIVVSASPPPKSEVRRVMQGFYHTCPGCSATLGPGLPYWLETGTSHWMCLDCAIQRGFRQSATIQHAFISTPTGVLPSEIDDRIEKLIPDITIRFAKCSFSGMDTDWSNFDMEASAYARTMGFVFVPQPDPYVGKLIAGLGLGGGGGGGGGFTFYYNQPLSIKSVFDGATKRASASLKLKDYHFPHVCPGCKGPAYIGFAAMECKAKCGGLSAKKA